ncbi:MAG: TRAP transporter large permease [Candidatus Hodarchaeota archaeon]
MSPYISGTIGLIVVFLLLFLRMPIALAFMTTGFLGLCTTIGFDPALSILGTVPYSSMSMYVWTVVPLFVFMGYLAQHTKLAEEFYDGIRIWLGHLRGGLASAVILGNTAFGACTGDTISSSVTFLTISLPEMRKSKYADSLTLGSIAAGCQLAALIPPSLPFIIYGAITETSIGKLFIAGLLPGLLLAVLYIGVIYILCLMNPKLAPAMKKTTFSVKIKAAAGMWALIIMFVVIIGGIYMGLFSPTEAGAAGAFVVLLIGFLRGRINWQIIKASIKNTAMTVPTIGFLVIGTMIFNRFMAMSGFPVAIAESIKSLTDSSIEITLIIVVIFIIMGMFIDALSLTLLMVPILYPVIKSMGIDPVYFGVVIVIVTALGTITPPFGIVVYAMSGAAKDVPLFSIFRGVAPFLVAMLICNLLVIFFPNISLLLPSMMAQ